MRYVSTRNRCSISHTFEEAICSGYAPDGGLFVPEEIPTIEAETHLRPWSKLTYPELAYEVLRLFVSTDELSNDDLRGICNAAFADGFDDRENAVQVRKLGSVFVAELFHGPTFCFKDLGMKAVVNLLSHFATIRQRRTTLLVSTTGDTGPAAVQAVKDTNNPLLSILVHYPHGQISTFQRRQLTTIHSPQVKVVAFEGGGDDMDLPIKRILASSSASSSSSSTQQQNDHGRGLLCGVNSYNIGRPLMQMVHYIWTYLKVVEQIGVLPGDPNVKVDIVLPTGAMGNIAGGYMAKKMGIPLGLLCSGVNINDITHRVMQTGKFYKSQCMEKTLSEAINVQVPYNFERLLYYLTNENSSLAREWMTIMDDTQKLDLDQTWLDKLKRDFRSARITDEEMCHTIRNVRDTYGYVVDPHTAVAISAAEKLGYLLSEPQPTAKPVAIFATASPCKFQEAVTKAIGEEGWEEYVKTQFPKRARDVLTKSELPPVVYKWKPGSDLTEVQTEWEKMALDLIDKLGQT